MIFLLSLLLHVIAGETVGFVFTITYRASRIQQNIQLTTEEGEDCKC